MTQGLLQVAEVVSGDGPWSAGTGQQFESRGCATQSYVFDICDVAGRFQLAGGADGAAPTAWGSHPFAIVATLHRETRCRLGDEKQYIHSAVDLETEKAVGRVLYSGLTSGSDNLQGVYIKGHPNVATAAAGADVQASIAAGLTMFWEDTVGAVPILHLGIGTALAMTHENRSILDDYGVKVATSPGYPSDALFLTGPVVIHLGTIEALETQQYSVNREMTEANRLASIQFDPCQAVYVTGA